MTTDQNKDELSLVLKILSFLFPIVGGYIYFKNKNDYPQKAKLAGILGLVGFVAIYILRTILI